MAPLNDRRLPLFVDDEGSLYPAADLSHVQQPSLDRSDLTSLRELAVRTGRNGGDAESGTGLCDTDAGLELTALCSSVIQGRWDRDLWDLAQEQMWRDRAERTWDLVQRADAPPVIVVLIHGFNVACGSDNEEGAFPGDLSRLPDHRRSVDQACEFQQIRTRLENDIQPEQPLIFVEVNWDGRLSGPGAERGWGEAQFSGPLVGYALRRYFNVLTELAHDAEANMPPVRIITHSSGAFVVGATFGNPIRMLPALRDPDQRELGYLDFYTERSSRTGPYRIPQLSDLRLAMLAPATGALTFSDGVDDWGAEEGYAPEFATRSGLLMDNATLMFTLNENDRGLGKGVSPSRFRFTSFVLGRSALGAVEEEGCILVENPPAGVSVHMVDFESDEANFSRFESHSVAAYLGHDHADSFLEALFSPSVGALPGQYNDHC